MYVKNIRFWSRFSSFFLLCSHTITTFALEKTKEIVSGDIKKDCFRY